jgi:hypothetical protein
MIRISTMKKQLNIEITELFMVKAGGDWRRRFMGTIVRQKAGSDKISIRGSVIINEGKIWSAAENEEQLGVYLDDLATLKLDCGIHGSTGVNTIIANTPFNMN